MDTYIAPTELENWSKLLLIYKFAVEEINTKLRIINEEFKYIHQYNPIEHLKDRIKKPRTIIEKLERKGLKVSIENAREHIHDIAGIRIICSFTSDIYTLFEILKRQHDIKVLKVKDYIKYPKANGYRSLHMIIQIPVFLTDKAENVKVEIQIRTIAMDFWASLEHKIYYKHKGEPSVHISDQLSECADIIKTLERKMLDIRNEITNLDKINKTKKLTDQRRLG